MGDSAEQAALEAVLTPIAEKVQKQAKDAGDDPEFCFIMVTEASGGLADRIRGMMKLESKKPSMVLMDIPDEGGYYVADADKGVTAETVEAFLADYKAKKLERKQLSCEVTP